jgi:2-oxoglutarate dehydrogenase E2 component (dihydrolipoamide succinyltransferase)
MTVELKVPSVGESITEVQIGEWLKKEGDFVKRDEVLVSIETDKVTVELPSPSNGVLSKIVVGKGGQASVGQVVGFLEEREAPAAGASPAVRPPSVRPPAEDGPQSTRKDAIRESLPPQAFARVMPSARRALREHGLQPSEVEATGPGGRLIKEDVMRYVEQNGPETTPTGAPKFSAPAPVPSSAPARTPSSSELRAVSAPQRSPSSEFRSPVAPAPQVVAAPQPAMPAPAIEYPAFDPDGRPEEAVAMTPMRRRIAERLVQSQQTAALLTTFNEIDMSGLMALRKQYQEAFQAKYGIKLGLMSFFVKAAIEALKLIPAVNAEIRGTDIIYKNYFDIGVAVGGGKGLVVPVIRNAERLSFAEVEQAIADYGVRAKDGKLKLEELQGGTFTISNGGIYGSLLSTPIVNPPQSGILGLHATQDRPVARDGQVVIRPMMYIALTYDHRLVDGREAVTFLKRIKECVEQPARILLEV